MTHVAWHPGGPTNERRRVTLGISTTGWPGSEDSRSGRVGSSRVPTPIRIRMPNRAVFRSRARIRSAHSLNPLAACCCSFKLLSTYLEEGLALPGDALVDVGGGVREALSLSGLAAEETVEVGADLVGSTSLEGVALSATGLEKTGTLGDVSCEGVSGCWRCACRGFRERQEPLCAKDQEARAGVASRPAHTALILHCIARRKGGGRMKKRRWWSRPRGRRPARGHRLFHRYPVHRVPERPSR
jgi:hypothetical protein